MKTLLVVPLVGLAISFALPTFAQQTLSPEAVEKADALAGKYDQASSNNDPAAVAAIFAEDAVLVTPDKTIVGREAIEKQYTEWYQGGQNRKHKTTYDPASYEITGTTDAITFSGGWSETVEVKGKTLELKGRWLAVDVRGNDGWKIWKLCYNLVPPAAPTASNQ
jgi:uncharacterized protein (TIGR02246 family)